MSNKINIEELKLDKDKFLNMLSRSYYAYKMRDKYIENLQYNGYSLTKDDFMWEEYRVKLKRYSQYRLLSLIYMGIYGSIDDSSWKIKIDEIDKNKEE